jgi:molecular chaperone GrpE (heat shock protein)
MIARDLYRLQQEVEKLEKEIKAAPYEKRVALEDQLRKVRAERNRLRRILEGSKEPPLYRKPR